MSCLTLCVLLVACRYQVMYTRTPAAKAALSLAGRLHFDNDANEAVSIALPNITLELRTGQSLPVPKELVLCPALTVPASSILNCKFSFTKAGIRPTAGTAQASVEVPATDGKPAQTLRALPVQFNFTNAKMVTEGEFAEVSDFFEVGPGVIQPYSIHGTQPSTNLRIGDSKAFKFTGWYGGLDQSYCGKALKVRLHQLETPAIKPRGP